MVSFFGRGPSRIFGSLHTPLQEPVGGLVICCPLQAELLRNYRREVLLGRLLAAKGIAVQRFHYRGAGHSDGDTSEMTLDSMIDDALAARDELVARTGVESIAFLGTRWSGLVAAGAARSCAASLALWEPVVQPQRYIDEILRFRLMYELKADPDTKVSHDTLLAQLERSGAVDILGHTVERGLYESVAGRSLPTLLGDGPPPSVLLIQIGVKRALAAPYAALAETWRARGAEVETHVVRDREAWWLSGDLWPVHEDHPPTISLLDLTMRWVLGDAPFDAEAV